MGAAIAWGRIIQEARGSMERQAVWSSSSVAGLTGRCGARRRPPPDNGRGQGGSGPALAPGYKWVCAPTPTRPWVANPQPAGRGVGLPYSPALYPLYILYAPLAPVALQLPLTLSLVCFICVYYLCVLLCNPFISSDLFQKD